MHPGIVAVGGLPFIITILSSTQQQQGTKGSKNNHKQTRVCVEDVPIDDARGRSRRRRHNRPQTSITYLRYVCMYIHKVALILTGVCNHTLENPVIREIGAPFVWLGTAAEFLPASQRQHQMTSSSSATGVFKRALTTFALLQCLLFTTCPSQCTCSAYQLPTRKWTKSIKRGYEQRVAADPSFPAKSVTEVLLAAGTQLSAEWNRRGAHRLLPEIDFVFPAMVAAVVGKYYRYVCTSMCRDDTYDCHQSQCQIFGRRSIPTAVQSRFLWNRNSGV